MSWLFIHFFYTVEMLVGKQLQEPPLDADSGAITLFDSYIRLLHTITNNKNIDFSVPLPEKKKQKKTHTTNIICFLDGNVYREKMSLCFQQIRNKQYHLKHVSNVIEYL